MDIRGFTQVALPFATFAVFLFAMVLPSVRLRRRTGKPALALHREANPFQRVIGLAMGLFMLAVLVWSALHVFLGDEGLGIWRAPSALGWSGWGLVTAGLVLTMVAQAQMGASWRIGIDTARTELVTDGLFSVVRNPIFTGMLAMVSGIVLVTPSAWTVMALGHYVLLVSLQVRLEEEHLLRLHGDAYRAYAARVGRFLPGVGRLATRLRGEVAPVPPEALTDYSVGEPRTLPQ